jgi:hypothetical protein
MALFSMMSAIKIKSRNGLSPKNLEDVGSENIALRKNRKDKNPTQDNSEHENMVAYNSFTTPDKINIFEEGISSENPTVDAALSSIEDAFVSTLFDFD